jgi:hypothetical protein
MTKFLAPILMSAISDVASESLSGLAVLISVGIFMLVFLAISPHLLQY